MRFQLIHLPAAAAASLLCAGSAHAENFMTLEQAQALIFPGARFTPADFTLSNADMDRLTDVATVAVYRGAVKVWKVSGGGWFYLDQVLGLNDRVTYAVGLNPDGTVKGVEVLVGISEYGKVRGPWRTQFFGKSYSRAHLSKSIRMISGTTMTSAHITDGITRILATHAMFTTQRK